jgi:hypothetical protein
VGKREWRSSLEMEIEIEKENFRKARPRLIDLFKK